MSDDPKVILPEVWNRREKREKLLMRRTRLRRTRVGERPDEPYRPSVHRHLLDCGLTGYEVRYRRGRWVKLHVTDEGRQPMYRDTFAWVLEGDQRVGAVALRELSADWLLYRWEFWTALDSESAELAYWADGLLAAWPELGTQIFAYGNVLELRTVWAAPDHAQRGLWKPVAHALIQGVKEKWAILAAHCFPLEYEGMAPTGSASELGFRRKRAAMVRACAREFGMELLPGQDALMWRPGPGLAGVIAAPVFEPDWHKLND